MNVTLAPNHAGSLFSPGSCGVGDVARLLMTSLKDIAERLDATVSLGYGRQETLREVYEVLEECGRSNWNGYGSLPVSFATYESAKQFLLALPRGIRKPEVSADPDGEISFEWYASPSRVFSVSISANNEINYAGLFGASRAYGSEVFHDEIPQVVLAHVRRVAS
jgi:hypothetical protein